MSDLRDADYRSWPRFPGELYTGSESHGMLLTTYVNSIAREALAEGAGSSPKVALAGCVW